MELVGSIAEAAGTYTTGDDGVRVIGVSQDRQINNQPVALGGADLTFAGHADGYRIALIATPGSHLALTGAATALEVGSAPAAVALERRVDFSAPDLVTASSGTVEAQLEAPTLRIAGDMRVLVWGTHVQVRTPGGVDDYPTGPDTGQEVRSPDGTSVVDQYQEHELLLDLQLANLNLTSSEATRVTAYLSHASLEVSGGDIQGVALGRIQGDAQLQLNEQGTFEQAQVAPATPGSGAAGSALWLVGLVLVAGVSASPPIVGHMVHRSMGQAMDSGRYERARRMAGYLRWSRKRASDAAMAGTISNLSLGNLDDAEKWLHRPGWQDATRLFLMARLLAMQNRPAEAMRWLAGALAEEPALIHEADHDPVLRPMLDGITQAVRSELEGYD